MNGNFMIFLLKVPILLTNFHFRLFGEVLWSFVFDEIEIFYEEEKQQTDYFKIILITEFGISSYI